MYKARDKTSKQLVALKKIRMENEREGFPITALREIKLLMRLKHPSVIRLQEIVSDDTDSETILRNSGAFYMVGVLSLPFFFFFFKREEKTEAVKREDEQNRIRSK